jgi:Phage tail lysozyme
MLVARPAVLLAFAGLCLALALAGCSDAAPVDPSVGTSEAAVITPYTFTNDKTAYEYFVTKGLKNFQAAGIVGNLDQESGASPTAVQGGGPGRGIAQWSVGGRWDTDGNDNATAYASQHGQSVWALGLQLDFIWYELTTFSGYGLAKLKATTNVTDATIVFQTDFEGCGTCVESQRIAYAKAVLAAYGTTPDYAAEYVGQSFPVATTTMKMTGGQVVPSYIELKNVGAKTWDSNTRLAPTQPRDRKSAFANGSWVSPTRAAEVKGTVPPGGTYKFAFDLAAPNKTATYDEFFGVVQEGVAWFSDSGQGGPVDNQLEVKIAVTAVANPPPPPDGGGTDVDGGDVGTDDGGPGGAADQDGGLGDPTRVGSSGGGGGGNGVAPTDDGATSTSGCSVGAARGPAPAWPFALGLFAAAGARIRARRPRKS